MAEVGSASVAIIPTFKGFRSKVSDEAEGAGKESGGRFSGAFKGAAAALVGIFAVDKLFSGLGAAVSEAANLEQSVGAINTVFKDSGAQMSAWADSAAQDVGLSKNEFNELGTLIGSQLKNGGTAMEELAPKTKDLITLGADLSSMFGGTTADAVGALSSALKGERDPIERFGVSLNQAKIDAEAAALGFSKVDGALSAEANQAATLSLIMKQTADAHGNFGRETDTLAHKQQVLNAQLANGKARIGTELLPVVAAFTSVLSSALGPAINGTVAGIKRIVGAGQGLYDLFAKGDFSSSLAQAFNVSEDSGFVNFLFKIRDATGEVAGGFRAFGEAWKANNGDVTSSGFAGIMERLANGAREITGGITAMFAAFKAGDGDVTSSGFAGFMEQVGGTARQVFDALAPAIAALMPMFGALVPQILQIFQALSPTSLLFQALLPVLPQIAQTVGQLLTTFVGLAVSLSSQLLPIITQLVASILPPLITIFGDVAGAIAPLITQLAAVLIPIIMALMPVVVTVFSVVADVIKNAMQIVQGIIQVVTGIISGDWDKVWTGIANIFSGIWNTIVALVKGALQIVGQVVISGLGLALAFVTSTLGSIGRFFSDTWANITRGVGGFIDGFIGFFRDLPGKIQGALSGAATWLLGIGKNIIQGLINGITGMAGTVARAILNLIPEAIRGPIEAALGIHSPSRVAMWWGHMIGDGLAGGIDDSQRKVAASMGSLASIPNVAGASVGGSISGGIPAIYVQNPFTGDYLLAQVDGRAAAQVQAADSQSSYMRRGR